MDENMIKIFWNQVETSAASKPINELTSLRNLQLKFKFNSYSILYDTLINMSNINIWKGEKITAQVLRLNEAQLLLSICESETSKLYTVLVHRNTGTDSLEESKALDKTIFNMRNLKVYSLANLQVNCTTESESENSGKNIQFSFLSILILFLASFLMS